MEFVRLLSLAAFKMLIDAKRKQFQSDPLEYLLKRCELTVFWFHAMK